MALSWFFVVTNLEEGSKKVESEQLIFAIIAFTLFIYMFYKMIKDNETSYVILIILQAIGIALNFFEIIFKIKINI